MKAYRKKYYDSGENIKQRKRVKARKQDIKEWYKEWKEKQSCYVCQEDATECLDLHHLDSNEKEYLVSRLVAFGSMSRMKKEIAKCVVLCSNCHRKVHSGRISLAPAPPSVF